MKKLFALAMCLVLALSLMAGCSTVDANSTPAPANSGDAPANEGGGGGSLAGDASEEYYMISFLSGIDYWKTCFKGMEDAAALYGVKAVYAGDPSADVAKQVTVFEQVVAMNPKGIAVTCVNAEALKEPIDKAREAGIEVVTFDSDSPASTRSSYLSTGNEEAGAKAAEYIAELLGGKGNVAVLYTVGAENSESRVKGFKDWCEKNAPDVKVVADVNDKGDQIEATKNMSAALQADDSINAVFCVDGVAGVAGPTAVSESGRDDIKVLSFDVDSAVLDMVKNGQIEATVAQGQYNMGYWSMNFLYHLAHDLPEADLPNFVDTGITIVTKDNVDDYYVQ